MAVVQQRFDLAEDNAHTGFRLGHFEWYNWGTYDGDIFTLDLERENGLLTGDIGSGKSTVVDALTTLLVPHSRIVYNKAAGAQSKERSLYSYIVGEYKSVRDETFGSAKAATLRDPNNTFSVLLACFENEGYDERVILAQFFWISKGSVQKFYVVSQSELSISKDFFEFSDIRDLKRRLKKVPHTEVFDAFKEYSGHFRRIMGIRNEQALHLFYQTVSLKSIGNLTEFIRNHMLEPSSIDEKVDAVCANFAELTRAHNLIVEAQKQIEMLTPIEEMSHRYEKMTRQREEFRDMRERLEIFFAIRRIDLLDVKLKSLELEYRKKISKKELLSEELEHSDEKIVDLKLELQKNGADRLEQLQRDIKSEQKKMQQLQKAKKRYDELCETLELAKASNEHRFLKNQEIAQERFSQIEEERTKLQNERVRNGVALTRYKEEGEKIESEIAYLQKRRSNIPPHVARIRDEMAEALELDAEELPFAGELIRCSDKAWQGAAERVLHNFALSLIVDTRYYERVVEYVENTQLDGKLVYLKVDRDKEPDGVEITADSLLKKIEIKADSPFANAVESLLFARFDIPCVKRLEEFYRLKRAVTIRGQFKTSYERHEKDDRHAIDDRSRWVLGWDNAQKLDALKQERDKLREKILYLSEEIEKIEGSLKDLTALRDTLRDLLSYDSFTQIDWYTASRRIEALEAEWKQLQESSDIIADLTAELERVILKRKKLKSDLDELISDIGKTQQQIEDNLLEYNKAKLLVENAENLEETERKIEQFAKDLLQEGVTLVTVDARKKELNRRLSTEIEKIDKRIGYAREKMIASMERFNAAFPVISKEFDASVESAKEYKQKLAQLKKDDLPRWRKRFKSLLREKMVQHFVTLQYTLEQQSHEIVEKIEKINASLRGIEYSEGTYIALIAEEVKSAQIREFKQKLKSAIEGAIGEDNSYDEQKFLQIKEIIERFNGREGHSDEDRKWRKRVTDVRNWFDFSAEERYVVDGTVKEYYEDSGGKSGGQKEKLAYTVLASSLAFQFGLEHNRIKSRSFRFVMIDEAFGRGSDTSTRYALRLFESLDLQLLVITPKQKINVIEPYVKTVHFVHNEGGMSSSILSMRIEEFQKRKEER